MAQIQGMTTNESNKKKKVTTNRFTSIGSTIKDTAKNTKSPILTTAPAKVTTPAKTTTPTKSSYGASTNVKNENAYLDSLIAKGGGEAAWAKSQKAELNKLTPTSGTSGSSYTPTAKIGLPSTAKMAKDTASGKTTQVFNDNSNKSNYNNLKASDVKAQQVKTTVAPTKIPTGGAKAPTPVPFLVDSRYGTSATSGGTLSVGNKITNDANTQSMLNSSVPNAMQTPTKMPAVETMDNLRSQFTPTNAPMAPTQAPSAYVPNGGGAMPQQGTPTATQPQATGAPEMGAPTAPPTGAPQFEMPAYPSAQQNMNPQEQITQDATNIGGTMDAVKNLYNSYGSQSDEGAVAVAAQYSQMVSLLDQLEAQITGQIRSQMNGDDPGLQAAIGVIKEEAARMRDASLEDLNARGLVQSGVYAEALTRLNSGELTSIQQTVASQFGDLQTQLNNAMMSMAQARVSALSGNQTQLNSMLQADRQTQANIGLQGIGYGLEEQGQNLQNNQYYAGLNNQYNIAQMNDTTQRYGIDVGAATSVYGTDKNSATDIYKTDKTDATNRYNIDTSNALQEKTINNNYAVGMAGAKSSGSGLTAAMAGVNLDRDIYNDNKTREGQAILDNQYAQMGTQLQGLTQDNTLTPQQKIQIVNSSRYPEEVKAWATQQLNVYYPPEQQKAALKAGTPTSMSGYTPWDIMGTR